MELDFSGLNKLAFQMFDTVEQEEKVEEEQVKIELEKPKVETKQVNFQPEKQPTAPESQLNSVATAKLNVEKENQRKLNEMYGSYSENRAKASVYIAQLLKGARAGEAPVRLLLTACKCIGAMTGEKAFLEQIEGDIKAIYGEALLEPTAIKIALEDTENRLIRLQEAYKRKDLQPEDRKRIDSAIKAHKARIEYLGALDIDATLDMMF